MTMIVSANNPSHIIAKATCDTTNGIYKLESHTPELKYVC